MHHTRVFTDSHHTMQCQCVIKSVIDELHPMIIFETKSFVYKPKAFWMLNLELSFHIQNHVSFFFGAVNFLGLTIGSTRLPIVTPRPERVYGTSNRRGIHEH